MTTPDAHALPCPCPGLDILHADADCVVLRKPSGLHSVPGLGSDKHDSILTRLQQHDPDIRPAVGIDCCQRHGIGIIGLARARFVAPAGEQGKGIA